MVKAKPIIKNPTMKLKLPLLLFLILTFQQSRSQDVSFSPKFISFRNMSVSPTLNLQLNFPSAFIGEKPDGYKTIGGGGGSIGLGMDIYSPNSITGIYMECNYSILSFGIQNNQALIDSFDVTYFAVPVYLKFRIGAKDSRKHFWLALGGSVNFPMSCERKLFNDKTLLYTVKDNGQMVSMYSTLSSILAYEAFNKKDKTGLRAVIFLSGDYKMQNILNSNYSGFDEGNPNTNNYKSVGKYNEIDFRNVTINVGIKLLYRINRKPKS